MKHLHYWLNVLKLEDLREHITVRNKFHIHDKMAIFLIKSHPSPKLNIIFLGKDVKTLRQPYRINNGVGSSIFYAKQKSPLLPNIWCPK